MTKLKLYVWEDYATDYTTGLAFAIAEDSDQARQMIEDKNGYRDVSLAESPEVFPLDSPIAFQVTGGG